MIVDYTVSFEYITGAPQTIKGEVEATEVQTCARKALEQAKERFPATQWTSVVLVMMRKE